MTRRKPFHNRQVAALDATDYGATGPAAQARPSKIVAVEGKQVSSVRSEPVLVRRFACECHLDRLNARGQISDRQWKAGIVFRGKWLRAARHTPVTGFYGERAGKSLEVQQAIDAWQSVRQEVTEAVQHLGMRLSAPVIAVCGEDETISGRLRLLQEGLDQLAHLWNLDRLFCRDGAM